MRRTLKFWDEGRVGAADNMIIPWRIAVKIVLLLERLIFSLSIYSAIGSDIAAPSAVCRFFKRHKITFQKKPARGGVEARGCGAGAKALDARAGMFDPARLVFVDETPPIPRWCD